MQRRLLQEARVQFLCSNHWPRRTRTLVRGQLSARLSSAAPYTKGSGVRVGGLLGPPGDAHKGSRIVLRLHAAERIRLRAVVSEDADFVNPVTVARARPRHFTRSLPSMSAP